ncbi:unnamed protein product [Sphagnum compactum]
MMLRAVQTRRWAKLIACRVPSCSFAPRMRHSSTGNSPRFEQCFIAEHNAKDGRLFRFATLVLRGMQEGESPLAAWAHGRSLLGPRSPPTLAVVFISKPTQAAILAVQELASHFSSSAEVRSQEIPQALSVPQSLSPPSPNSSPSSSSSSWNASVESSSFALDVGEEKAEIVPLIGCVVENLGLEYGDDMQPLGSGQGERTENAGCRASSNFTGDRPSGTGGNNCGQNGGARLQANSSADGLDGVRGTPPLATGKVNTMSQGTLNQQTSNQNWDPKLGTSIVVGEESLGPSKDGEVVIPLEDALETPGTGAHKEDTDSDSENEDDKYVMVLCMGHMPGSQAAGFVSPTSGLPHLPNLERAVMTNNPHILMLGSPGFDFPEFHQRLSTVFPESTRAGVFMAPLFTTTQNSSQYAKLAEEKAGPLFYGTHCITKGVVGLAISSEEGADEIPVDAFAQFVRMSLGMPRMPGYTLLKVDVSKSLFLPSNVVLDEEQSQSERRNPTSITNILDQLSSHLLRTSHVPELNDGLLQKVTQGMRVDVKESSTGPKEHINGVVPPSEKVTAHWTGVPINADQSQQKGWPEELHVPSSLKNLADTLIENKELERSSEHNGGRRALRSRKVPFVSEELANPERMPLALFDAVLFPGWSLPFHIYEPCYRFMVRQCLEQGKPFGLSTMSVTSWNPPDVDNEDVIGTVANLKVHMFERDCRSFIIAHGIQRFRLLDRRMWVQPGSFGLNVGEVEYFDDEPCASGVERELVKELAKQAIDMCRVLVPEAQAVPGLIRCVDDPVLASFTIGHLLQIPNRVKRRWLKMVNTKQRLMEQLQFLEVQNRL